jgi:hypothetical protein
MATVPLGRPIATAGGPAALPAPLPPEPLELPDVEAAGGPISCLSGVCSTFTTPSSGPSSLSSPIARSSSFDDRSLVSTVESAVTNFKGKGKPPGPGKQVIKGLAAAGVGALVVRSITSPPGAPGGKPRDQGGKKVVTKTQVTKPVTTTTGPAKGGSPPPHRNQPPPRRKIVPPPVPVPQGPKGPQGPRPHDPQGPNVKPQPHGPHGPQTAPRTPPTPTGPRNSNQKRKKKTNQQTKDMMKRRQAGNEKAKTKAKKTKAGMQVMAAGMSLLGAALQGSSSGPGIGRANTQGTDQSTEGGIPPRPLNRTGKRLGDQQKTQNPVTTPTQLHQLPGQNPRTDKNLRKQQSHTANQQLRHHPK